METSYLVFVTLWMTRYRVCAEIKIQFWCFPYLYRLLFSIWFRWIQLNFGVYCPICRIGPIFHHAFCRNKDNLRLDTTFCRIKNRWNSQFGCRRSVFFYFCLLQYSSSPSTYSSSYHPCHSTFLRRRIGSMGWEGWKEEWKMKNKRAKRTALFFLR